ncbi:MAG: hypothetical protein AMJ90_01100 [candidate division Zixibacteria bacterium SM23_73_2]|nr:MAG: hypothetical protein AMJ90_01100 [candidate division Zixibacteria bacterium SM23_73_2]
MKRFFILTFLILSFTITVFAQDPGNPDTVYWEASGFHRGDTLYVKPGTFPADVSVDLMVWTDNGVSGVSLPFVDYCYDPVSMPTYLDYTKNHPDNEPNCFTGTFLEGWSIVSLKIYGVEPTPTPPNFAISAVSFTDSFSTPGFLAHLIFTVSYEGCLCLDTIPIFQPGGVIPMLQIPMAIGYVPQYVYKCFQIREVPFICGDVNANLYVDLSDVIYLANYKFKSGPAPYRFEAADVNCDQALDTSDIIILAKVNFGIPGFTLCCW